MTNKPQTTRTRIHGILDVPAKKGVHQAAQIVFVDTWGVHKPGTLMDRRMMQEVYDALESRDVVLLMARAMRRLQLRALEESETGEEKKKSHRGFEDLTEDEFVLELVRKLHGPVFLLLNKIDLVAKDKLLPLISQLTAMHNFKEVIPISASKGDGLDRLVARLIENLPVGQRYFPQDQFTDQPERFLVAELIRERILMTTGEEIPYASAMAKGSCTTNKQIIPGTRACPAATRSPCEPKLRSASACCRPCQSGSPSAHPARNKSQRKSA